MISLNFNRCTRLHFLFKYCTYNVHNGLVLSNGNNRYHLHVVPTFDISPFLFVFGLIFFVSNKCVSHCFYDWLNRHNPIFSLQAYFKFKTIIYMLSPVLFPRAHLESAGSEVVILSTTAVYRIHECIRNMSPSSLNTFH